VVTVWFAIILYLFMLAFLTLVVWLLTNEYETTLEELREENLTLALRLWAAEREVPRKSGAIEEEIYRCTNPKKASTESDCCPRRSIRANPGDTASGSEEAGDGGRFRFPDISPVEADRRDGRRDETV